MALSDIFGTAGSILSVATALPATHNKGGFEALTWKEVGLVSDLGSNGKTFNETTFTSIKEAVVVPRLTASDNGEQAITYAYTAGEDEGHELLDSKIGQKAALSVKLPNGKVRYFIAYVKGGAVNMGTVDNIVTQAQALRLTEDEILTEDAPV